MVISIPVSAVTNIAAYKFATLSDLKSLRERLIAQCKAWELKGTILLSTEGINLFVAGAGDMVAQLVTELHSIPGLEELTPKYSESAHQPFTRMLVRIKKEIIAFGVEGIDPARRTSPKLSAHTLKQWLDEGKSFTLLDTRNDYEVKLGTFKGARTFPIDHFRQFPDAVRQLPETMKEEPIVMFCTGGIRCEKAGPFMEREGFRSVFQLDGGILKYFEECGGAHYDGECFVFDQRVGVDPALQETESAQCFVCQTPLSAEDQADPRFVPGQSCPYCEKRDLELMSKSLAERNAAIKRLTTPLPGAEPYENRRPINIPAHSDGVGLFDFLTSTFPHVSHEEWTELIGQGRFRDGEDRTLGETDRVTTGERIYRLTPGMVEPDVRADVRIIYEDEAILVLEKPAPLPMHPCGRFNRNTLQFILNGVYGQQRPRPAHRLDANTTGLVVCARTRHFAGLLQPQFADGLVRKTYLAEVQGSPTEDRFVCDAPIASGPSEMGSREVDANGLKARTEFEVVTRRGESTVLRVRPITGRTNQIRLHLRELGFPILGDPYYQLDGSTAEVMTTGLDTPPLRLHASRLEFIHPVSRERVVFAAGNPDWL